MKKILSLLWILVCATGLVAEPYYVCVNGTDNYPAAATGQSDFQGRTQYAALCVPLKAGDHITCFDAGSGANWNIAALDPYGAYANFTSTASSLTCNQDGNYNLYIKMKYEDDMWYIESATDCTPVDPTDPKDPVYSSSAPAAYPGVMLQAFYWDSYEDKGYGRTKWIDLKTQATEIGQWFDLVWLPPSARSTGGTGYLPTCYSAQDGAWGTKANLRNVIDILHQNGARVVADIVVNHVAGSSGWCTLSKVNFGTFGSYSPDMSWICSTDEAFTGGHCSGATGAADDGYGSEANYEAGRDWDHNNSQVREMIKSYLKWMREEMKYDGFRYDYCKGFHNSHINEYNTASEAFFSVMEMWDGNPEVLKSHLNDAGYNTCTFDFGTKYGVFNQGIAADNYYIQGKGLLGAGKSRYAVTFVDSHDSFQRDDNEFCGKGNSMKYPDKLLQCNAYLLSMPGVPCVFYPHWVTFKTEIKAMINARYKVGVHSESAVSDEAGNGYYKATITGTNGTLRLLLGPNSGYANTPSGYTKAASGTNWGVYYKLNSAIGDKPDNRQQIGDAVEEVEARPATNVQKVVEGGQLYIIVDGVRYSAMGQRM